MKTYNILLSFFLILISGMGFSQSVPSYVPTNGLVGWWGFNGNAQDGSGNGNHGTVNGATLTTDRFGNQNQSFYFDGQNDFIGVNAVPSLLPSNLTISTWVKIPSLYTANNPIGRIIRTRFFGYILYFDSISRSIKFETFNNSFSPPVICVSSGVNYNDDLWHHIVVTFDGYLNKLMVDGILVASIPSVGPNLYYQSDGLVTIGKDGNNTHPQTAHYQGWIDDIGIWNRAISPQEITNLYNSQLPTQTSLCLPTITTSSPTSVGVDTVVIGGDISNDGGSSIVLRGICYSTSPNPNMGNQRTEDGSGTGSFNTVLRGFTPSTTYYARSYAKNSNGVVVYGNEVSFTTSLPGLRCPGTPTVADIDGNIYNTVQIGNQCWTQSNLKTSRYRNGDSIPTGLNHTQWSSTTSGAYAIWDNDFFMDSLYGKLFNYYAVMDSRGLCPTGWHVPSVGEWTTLENNLGGFFEAGGAMKSTRTLPLPDGWFPPNTGATNTSGFSALAAGSRSNIGDFNYRTASAFWWSSTISSASNAWYLRIYNHLSWLVLHEYYGSTSGFSVRCLKNTFPQVNSISVTNVTPSTALVTGEVISEGDQNTTRGFCYSTTSNPTISNDTTMNGTGTGVYSNTLQSLTPSNTYYVRAYATNSLGTSYGTELSFTTPLPAPQPCPGTPSVTDIDGNLYHTVQIGSQCWTQSNLKVSKYRNGDTIPTGLSDSAWQNTTSWAYAIYNNDPANDGLYGKLYNHYAVTDSRGLCPTGWHVPSDGEWTTLENHLGGSSVAGGALKSTAMQPTPGGWNSPNAGATNSSGFTALPGGLRSSSGGFNIMTDYGFWWSSSISSASDAWCRSLNYYFSYVYRPSTSRTLGFSVRCLKD